MKKNIPTYPLVPIVEQFIRVSKNGRRRFGNGNRVKAGTIRNYEVLLKHLQEFEKSQPEPLRLRSEARLSKTQLLSEKKYWQKFFTAFAQYLHKRGCYDNYVGFTMKNLRIILRYAQNEKMIVTDTYRSLLYVTKEELPVITLTPERFRFLIHDSAFYESLSPTFQTIHDIFVFGCTVALRFSDLMAITQRNIECVGDLRYLSVSAIKTGIPTRVRIPDYAFDILERNANNTRKTF